MSVWSIALTLFLVSNPIGNIPVVVSLVKDFPFERQRKILFRESIFSFILALTFLYVGEPFLHALQIEQYAVSISGGILLFMMALKMIFPPEHNGTVAKNVEPFIVPIATPLISGGGVLTTILIYSAKEQNYPKITLACVIAWIGVTVIITSSAYLKKILGQRGLLALEQLMGMILSMLSMEIIVKGVYLFINASQAV